MARYSITKGPNADNVVALTKNPGSGVTDIEVTKNPGGVGTVAFKKNAATKARIVKSGGGSFELYPSTNAAGAAGNEANATTGWATANGATHSSVTDPHSEGGTYAYRVDGNNNASAHTVFDLSGILSDGVTYKISYAAKSTTGDSWRIGMGATAPTDPIFDSSLTSTSYQYVEDVQFVYSLSNPNLVLREQNASDAGGVIIDSISITTA